MDYLLAGIIGFGILTFALAYLRNSMENRYYKDYFFVLSLITLACTMVILFNATNFSTQIDSTSYVDLLNNTITNQTESYMVPEAVQSISGNTIILLISTTMFIVILTICGYIYEMISSLFKKDKLKSPDRIAHEMRHD